MRTFVWTGGGFFVAALAYCGYTYVVVWSRVATFDPASAAIDALLFSVFALHHSLFARDVVKQWMARFVPDPLLRSVYVWIASLMLIAVCAAWQPIGGDAYRHTGVPAAIHAAVQLLGVAIIVSAVRTIDALELAGIRQHTAPESLQITGPYRWVRHPLYSGWLLATFGAAHMTGDRLIFAGIAAFYLLIAMPLEERSLQTSFGAAYDDYRRRVRFRVLPYVY